MLQLKRIKLLKKLVINGVKGFPSSLELRGQDQLSSVHPTLYETSHSVFSLDDFILCPLAPHFQYLLYSYK